MRGRTVHSRVLAVVAAAITALVTAVVTAAVVLLPESPAVAHAKLECDPPVGIAQVDPIVQRGSQTSEHLHEFFGNKRLMELGRPDLANYADLVGQATSCENPGDSAAYWSPVLFAAGVQAPIKAVIAYYRSFNHLDKGEAEPYPADARMVAKVTNWTCGQNSSRPGPFPDPNTANCGTATGNVRLTAHVDFPSCWDGRLNDHTVNGNTADFSALHPVTQHFAYTSKGPGGSRGVCPAGFPRKVPDLRLAISYGDGTAALWRGKTITFSHATYHADFWNTWDPTALANMVQFCINQAPSKHHSGGNVPTCGS